MANRGSVVYTEAPAVPVGTQITASLLKQLCDIISVNLQEWNGLRDAIANEPTVPYSKKKVRRRNSGYETVLTNIKNSINAGNIVYANDFNKLIERANHLYAYWKKTVTTQVYVGNLITAQTIGAICSTLRTISTYFNSYNSYWSYDTCNVNCQVSCMHTCMRACQGCHDANCHNQHCGT
jgi:hypothetical protein